MLSPLSPAFDLQAIARRVVRDQGFPTDPAPAPPAGLPDPLAAPDPAVRDLTGLLWSSIDNEDSRDLDQIEYATREPGGRFRVLVGIADVDAFVPRGSAADLHAAAMSTSLYAGVLVFPMLAPELSTARTSLLSGGERLAVVTEFAVTADGEVECGEVYRARVRNAAKLDYDALGPWLEGRAPLPAEVAAVDGLEEQLRIQDEAREKLRAFRRKCGALDFASGEARPIIAEGRVVDLQLNLRNQARELIESFMVAANGAMASFLEAKGSLTIQRLVRTPKRWERIVDLAKAAGSELPAEPNSRALADFMALRRRAEPGQYIDLSLAVVKLLGAGEYAVIRPDEAHDGHFGLAVQDYTHSTAPNRRYVDLVTQRLVKAALAGQPGPYGEAELVLIAEHANERATAARKVERVMRKAAAAVLLSGHLGEIFEGIVTGAAPKGTFVRLHTPPAEGRIVRGEHGLDVGDAVRVRLLSTAPEQGFIDFERVA